MPLIMHTMHNTSYDTTLTLVFCYSVMLFYIFAAFNVDFTGERGATIGPAQIIKCTTFNSWGYAWDEAHKIWIPPIEEDWQRERNLYRF